MNSSPDDNFNSKLSSLREHVIDQIQLEYEMEGNCPNKLIKSINGFSGYNNWFRKSSVPISRVLKPQECQNKEQENICKLVS